MFTNTYLPLVGGIEKSVQTFCEDFGQMGHFTRIITPEARDENGESARSGKGVLRVPAITGITEKNFSIQFPTPSLIDHWMEAIQPDIVHAHQPFMLGDTALRMARKWRAPLIFTHHTLYERYAHYFMVDNENTRRFAATLSVQYGNLCDLVIAPTESIKRLLEERGIKKPVRVVPTGIQVSDFSNGDREGFRQKWNLPPEARVVGQVGRLNREKNLDYVAEAVQQAMAQDPKLYFLLVGEGELVEPIRESLQSAGLADRFVHTGVLKGQDVIDAYSGMDLFVFASKTDTQGIVLAESFAGGTPVLAIDAPGARDCIEDGYSGRVLPDTTSAEGFAAAILDMMGDDDTRRRYSEQARAAANQFDRGVCAERMLEVYREAREAFDATHPVENKPKDAWSEIMDRLDSEWSLLAEKYEAAKSLLA
ncbi:MAG: glycosyltransferase [Verrucomicrobiota bacterium JB022]|nr:glycosyltransferase [Verrucomicrobiota bacterium JB022]